MRRVVVVAALVSALVGVVGAESIFKARHALPQGSVTVEEVETVMVEAPALKGESTILAAAKADQPSRGTSYAMY